jgi:hypothetical protein
MKTISVNSDTHYTNAIGAALQWQLWTFCLSKLYNKNYYFNGFKRIEHFEFENMESKDFDLSFDKFFNLEKHSVASTSKILKIYDDPLTGIQEKSVYKNRRMIQRTFDRNINKIYKKNIFLELKNEIKISNFIVRDAINVSIHLRVLNNLDLEFDDIDSFKLFNKDPNSVKRVNRLIAQIEQKYPLKKIFFHLVIQNPDKKLKEVKINNPINSLKVHSDLNVYESLKLLISSDILVCSNSSFSYVAHIISGSESYFSSDFRYKIYPNSRYYDDFGNILI